MDLGASCLEVAYEADHGALNIVHLDEDVEEEIIQQQGGNGGGGPPPPWGPPPSR